MGNATTTAAADAQPGHQTRSGSRLLFICQGYPPFHGGAEQATAVLAEQAAACGLDVHVLTSDLGGRLPSSETRAGVHVTRLPCRKRKWSHHSVPELLFFYAACRRRLRALQQDIAPSMILAHFTMPAGLVALRWHDDFGVPYAVVLHGADVPGHEPGRFRLLHPFMRVAARRVWRRASHVIAVSRELAGLARRTWADGEIKVIPNGVDTLRFHPLNGDREPGPLRLVLLSRLVHIKGIDVLLRALQGMPRPRLEACRVDVYGTGPEQRALEQAAASLVPSGRVSFHGVIRPEAVPAVLRKADMFVLPSRREGLPISLLEAMATGLPAVASSVGEVPEVIRDGENGLLVPADDTPALRNALLTLMDDRQLRTRMGTAARRTAETYSSAAVWRQYAECLGTGKG